MPPVNKIPSIPINDTRGTPATLVVEIHATPEQTNGKETDNTTTDILLSKEAHTLDIRQSDTQQDIIDKIDRTKEKVQRAYDMLTLTNEGYKAKQLKEVERSLPELDAGVKRRITLFIERLPQISAENSQLIQDGINAFALESFGIILSNILRARQAIQNVIEAYNEIKQRGGDVTDAQLATLIEEKFRLFSSTFNEETTASIKKVITERIRGVEDASEQDMQQKIVQSVIDKFVKSQPIKDRVRQKIHAEITQYVNQYTAVKEYTRHMIEAYNEIKQRGGDVTDAQLATLIEEKFQSLLTMLNKETTASIKKVITERIRGVEDASEQDMQQKIVQSVIDECTKILIKQPQAEQKRAGEITQHTLTSSSGETKSLPEVAEKKMKSIDEGITEPAGKAIPNDQERTQKIVITEDDMQSMDDRITEFVKQVIPNDQEQADSVEKILKLAKQKLADIEVRTAEETTYLQNNQITIPNVQSALSAIKSMSSNRTNQGKKKINEQRNIPGVLEALAYEEDLQRLDTIKERFTAPDYIEKFHELMKDKHTFFQSLPKMEDLDEALKQIEHSQKLHSTLTELGEIEESKKDLKDDVKTLDETLNRITEILASSSQHRSAKQHTTTDGTEQETLFSKIAQIQRELESKAKLDEVALYNEDYTKQLTSNSAKLDRVKSALQGKIDTQCKKLENISILKQTIDNTKNISSIAKVSEVFLKIFDRLFQPDKKQRRYEETCTAIEKKITNLEAQIPNPTITVGHTEMLKRNIDNLKQAQKDLQKLYNEDRRITRMLKKCLDIIRAIPESTDSSVEGHTKDLNQEIISEARNVINKSTSGKEDGGTTSLLIDSIEGTPQNFHPKDTPGQNDGSSRIL